MTIEEKLVDVYRKEAYIQYEKQELESEYKRELSKKIVESKTLSENRWSIRDDEQCSYAMVAIIQSNQNKELLEMISPLRVHDVLRMFLPISLSDEGVTRSVHLEINLKGQIMFLRPFIQIDFVKFVKEHDLKIYENYSSKWSKKMDDMKELLKVGFTV